jgi:hypothetical protein
MAGAPGFASVWAGLFLASLACTMLAGPNPLSAWLYPIPIAVCLARSRWRQGLILLAGLALSGAVGVWLQWPLVRMLGIEVVPEAAPQAVVSAGLGTALSYSVIGASGFLAGAGLVRRWTYGQVTALVAAGLFVAATAYVVALWGAWDAHIDRVFESIQLSLKDTANRNDAQVSQDQLDTLNWMQAHKASLGLGIEFIGAMGLACIIVAGATSVLRRWFGEPGPAGSFAEMRPPEWMVWLAIASALACMADAWWPSPTLRFLGWNSAIILAVIYWLNGLGITLHFVNAVQPKAILLVLLLLVLANAGTVAGLFALGFVDTWAGFRRKIDAFVARRKADGNSGADRF